MKSVSFTKIYSRLGLTNKPFHQKEFNYGVENGPDAILSKEFLKQFPKSKLISHEFPLPEKVVHKNLISILVKNWTASQKKIEKVSKGSIQVTIGGDHIITLPAFAAFIKGKDLSTIGYVHFDTHGDINLYKDSPTKNFHGMYVRAWADRFDVKEVDSLFPKKLPTENMFFVGNLELDPGEKKFFKEKKIQYMTQKMLLKDKKKALEKFATFINSFDHLYVTIDIDVFDRKFAPATGTPPSDKGYTWEELEPFFKAISHHKDFAFDIAEVNPAKKGGEKTVKLAQKLLLLLLGKL